MGNKVRIGIDVGGTFTKAVALDSESYEIIGKATTLTTHDAPEGVARGVIEVFHKCLKEFKIDPKDVVFLAHSTTQATNALLEGDVAPVGLISMGRGFEKFLAKFVTKIKDIEVAPNRYIKIYHTFLDSKKFDKEIVEQAIKQLTFKGAKSIVASEAFSVDDPTNELYVMECASRLGIPATGAHEISKLYGLSVRTRTAVINASILPKMIETANMVEYSMQKVGIRAPLMIMRGDGGLMALQEFRKRPLLTALSGPAASVAGALMYLRVSDGIFFEVGGTSTNVGVIRRGRPAIKFIEIGGHPTYVKSLDVRVIGIAGGSMVRVRGKEIVDVGPRSAHIAGLHYSTFARTEEMKEPEVVLIKPRPGDPSDYVAIKTKTGKLFAITNTCAANALGLTKPGDYAYGNPEAARKAIEPLARMLGLTVEETAKRILEKSAEKVIAVINKLIDDYKLEGEDLVLVGGGGGASVLIPFVAKKLGLSYKIPQHAEVISSIGVAMAMILEVVERQIVNPTPEDIIRIKKEAEAMAIKSGAKPETVEVTVEVDQSRYIVRATASGTTELRTKDLLKKAVALEEAKEILAKSMNVPVEKIKRVESSDYFYVFSIERERRSFLLYKRIYRQIRVMDREGVVRLSIKGNPIVVKCPVKEVEAQLQKLIEKLMVIDEGGEHVPQIYLLHSKITDLSGLMTANQIMLMAHHALTGLAPDEEVIIIAERYVP